ncbi:exo-alpha-sialidase [Actinomycetaceae bacterium TAE3-ERU4]|nr:exo-alpha-sialidase [Actinomycetaceae bacterium TAE3-ERU4]
MDTLTSISWNSTTYSSEDGTLECTFSGNRDGLIWHAIAEGDKFFTRLEIRSSYLLLNAFLPNGTFEIEMEDTVGLTDSAPHYFAMTFGDFGTRFYLDGYQCFSSATNFGPLALAQSGTITFAKDNGVETKNLTLCPDVLSAESIVSRAGVPSPLVEFSAAYLAKPDLELLKSMTEGTLFTRFRARGPHQYGTILAAAAGDNQQLELYIDNPGITYRVFRQEQWQTIFVPGSWNDGKWHDLIVRAARGAVDIYVDGNSVRHEPGQAFFGHVTGLDRVSIGEDITGVRLMGEVRNGGIYPRALSEGEIKSLSSLPPLTTTSLYDKGFAGSASYRIPSLITTPRGTVIAGADQRVAISNDAPNKINFVIRRSLDSGATWLPLQTVIEYPGEGVEGACTIDSCLVCDRQTGRVIVLIDHFPGGIGLPNNEPGLGVNSQGQTLLYDKEGSEYVLCENGVVEKGGNSTPFRVDEAGNVTVEGNPGGNIYLKLGVDPHETLHTARTSYVLEIHSDDEGETWSTPRIINHQVKEDWMHFLGVSPGNGIQLSRGKYSGRLLVPFYFTGASLKHYSGGALFSDDGGLTWERGKAINEGREINGQVVDSREVWEDDATTHESVLIERENGEVVVFFRNQHQSGCVGKAVSRDRGYSWDELEFDASLPDIFSQPNAVTLPPQDCRQSGKVWNEGSDLVVFANASQMLPYRGRGVLRFSSDGGHSWEYSRCFNPYHYVYQCLSVLPDMTLGLLWERETAGVYFTKFPIDWLLGKN